MTTASFLFSKILSNFARVMLGEDARWLYRSIHDGDQIDLCTDALRYEAEEHMVDALGRGRLGSLGLRRLRVSYLPSR